MAGWTVGRSGGWAVRLLRSLDFGSVTTPPKPYPTSPLLFQPLPQPRAQDRESEKKVRTGEHSGEAQRLAGRASEAGLREASLIKLGVQDGKTVVTGWRAPQAESWSQQTRASSTVSALGANGGLRAGGAQSWEATFRGTWTHRADSSPEREREKGSWSLSFPCRAQHVGLPVCAARFPGLFRYHWSLERVSVRSRRTPGLMEEGLGF